MLTAARFIYGKHNEILMTVKDNGKFYSYWAASVTDPSATMETYPVSKYNSDLAVIDQNIKNLNKDIIKEVTGSLYKEVTLTKDTNSAIIRLVRNGGNAVDGAITVTSGGGTDGSGADNDTFVKISNAADTEGKTFATGSKVEAIVDNNGATTGIKINGEDYTIKSGSKVSVTQTADKKTTTITVDGTETTITDTDTHNALKSASLSGKTLIITGKDDDSVNVDLSSIDTDTKYTAGNGIAIDENNGHAISVKLNKDEKNLVVDDKGLALNTELTGIQSINGVGTGAGSISFEGGNVKVNNVTIEKGGKITGVANGIDDNDAVNVSQLNKVSAAADKHTTLVNGENTTVEESTNESGGKKYKVNVKLDDYAKKTDVAVVYVDNNKEKSLHTTNSKAVGSNAIALGKGASAHDNSVVIGNGAYTQKGSILTGSGYSVALGNNAVTGTKSTSVGYKAIGGRVGTITVGYNSYNGAAYGTVIGTESKISYSDQKTANAAATIIGAQSEIIADNKPYSGVANGIYGSANTIKNSNGVTIQGSGNTVTDAYKDMDITLDEGSAILGGDYSVLAKKQSGAVAVVGGANTVSKQTDSTVIGYDNQLAGGAENISHDVFLAGSHNELTNVSDSIVMGNKNTINGVSNVISFGHQNTISANNAVAIGNGAGVSVEGGVALGVGSVADRAAEVVGYDPATGAGYVIPEDDAASYVWKATKGAVSVGSARETRQITNVAAGTEDTDAVNVAQLKKVSETAANANKGWKLKTKNGNASDVKPGDEVEFDGDANIQVGNDGNKVSVTLKDALTGITSITGAGEGAGSISFADGSIKLNNKVTIDKNGKISGVAAGEAGTDAVNVSQLNKVSAAAKTEVVKGTNIASVGETTATDGHTVYTVNAKGTSVSVDGNFNLVETTDAATNVTNYGISLKDSVAIGGTHAVTINGTDGTVTGLTNTTWNKDSITSGRAATEDQLHAVATEAGKHTTLSDGKNTTVNPVTTADGHLEYKVDVNDELKDIKSIIGAGEGAGSISFADGGIKLNNKVTINKDGKITGVAAGAITETSTDAVNGSQLHAVKTELQTSDKHLVGNPASADGYYKPDANGDISLRVEDQNKNGYDVVIKDVASKAELGNVANRVTNVENQVTQIENDVTTIKTDVTTIKTDITTIKTDINNINTRVDNVEALAGKHTTLEKNGTNINVEETVVDGQKNYKVNLNKDITLGDENGNNVSISGTNGTITATGDITTANRINAANGGKLADIDVTGNKLSNGNSSITLDGTNVKVNDKVTVDKDGKISGVAKGDISNTSTDAVNGSQLYDTNTHITNVENQVISNSNRINQLGNRVNKVGAGAAALAALHPMDFDPDDKLTFSAGYGNYGGENAAAIGAYYRPDEKVMFSVAGTVGNGENMVNAGISFALDRTNHVSNSRTALAREVIDLRGQLAVMGAKMAKMEKALGMLDETKTKLFPDIPANHWAYEYIAKLAGNGYIEGYPDGNFGGDRLMTRYEFATMLYRAIENGAALEEKIIKEFEPELGRIRVDRISGEDGDRDKIERVRVNDTKGERDHYGNKLAK